MVRVEVGDDQRREALGRQVLLEAVERARAEVEGDGPVAGADEVAALGFAQ